MTAFISEIRYDGTNPAVEYVEVTLSNSENPSDYRLTLYDHTGAIHTQSGSFGADGEILLSDAAVTAVPHPTAPGYTIYTVTDLLIAGNGQSTQAEAVSLFNVGSNTLVEFIDPALDNSITPTRGDAQGQTATNINFGPPGGANSYLQDIDGNWTLGPSTPDDSVVCFARGTFIKTSKGQTAIEDLEEGDLIYTDDNELKPVRWIGSISLDAIDLEVKPNLKPILIRKNSLGKGHPAEDLLVSPQHRILVRSKIAQRMFGVSEVLVPANKLIEIDGIDIHHNNPDGVEYFHMIFDEHEIICSNGAWTESLFTGSEALKAVSPEARIEIETLFPEICEPNFEPVSARYIPEKGKLMKRLVQRHVQNKKPLYIQ